jgi:hypothetical protein
MCSSCLRFLDILLQIFIKRIPLLYGPFFRALSRPEKRQDAREIFFLDKRGTSRSCLARREIKVMLPRYDSRKISVPDKEVRRVVLNNWKRVRFNPASI